MTHGDAIALLRDESTVVEVSLAYEFLEVSYGDDYYNTTHFYDVPQTYCTPEALYYPAEQDGALVLMREVR